jgi:hypothetical protein
MGLLLSAGDVVLWIWGSSAASLDLNQLGLLVVITSTIGLVVTSALSINPTREAE